jgi:spore maturation protein CgeB
VLILYVALKYDYGKKDQGYSFEHYNFFDSLLNMGHDLLYFDFMTLMQERGRHWMNRRLKEVVDAEKPDLLFSVLYRDEIDKRVIRSISEESTTLTLNWFCDDHWRFDDYSRQWAFCFNWIVTTDNNAMTKYALLGYKNAIRSQWGCNHFLYQRLGLPLQYDVTFIGQPHGNRSAAIQALRDCGIDVNVWGNGWNNGRITQEKMIQIFNQSRINLNLSNASVSQGGVQEKEMSHIPSIVAKSLKLLVTEMKARKNTRRLLETMKTFMASIAPHHTRQSGRDDLYVDQIKGRTFEVPGCGGFLLTGKAADLESYFNDGAEVVTFESIQDLIEKVRFYLSHVQQRLSIAEAGYQRTLADHTYARRFSHIFDKIGLTTTLTESLPERKAKIGWVDEV